MAAFVFAAVSSAYPFLAVAHMLDDDALARGQANRRALLRLYAECAAKNRWSPPCRVEPAFTARVGEGDRMNTATVAEG